MLTWLWYPSSLHSLWLTPYIVYRKYSVDAVTVQPEGLVFYLGRFFHSDADLDGTCFFRTWPWRKKTPLPSPRMNQILRNFRIWRQVPYPWRSRCISSSAEGSSRTSRSLRLHTCRSPPFFVQPRDTRWGTALCIFCVFDKDWQRTDYVYPILYHIIKKLSSGRRKRLNACLFYVLLASYLTSCYERVKLSYAIVLCTFLL